MGRYRPRVIRHRVRTQEITDTNKTRVLVITGLAHIVNVENLEARWAHWCAWETDDVVVRWVRAGEACVEYRFSNVQVQAEAASHTMSMRPQDFGGVHFHYGADPCA
jgi:hypothetical protein